MQKEIIHSSEVPSSLLYSQAVKVGNWIYLSGFTGMDLRTKQLAGQTIEEQTRQAIQNCTSVLVAAKSTLDEVVQVIVLLRDPEDFERMNSEYSKFFPNDPPARMVTKLGVNLPNVRVSIAMTAFAR